MCKWGCASGVMGEGGTWWYLRWPGSPLLRWRFPQHRHHSVCILSNGLRVLFLDCYGACAFHLKEGGIVELNMSLPFWQSKLGQAGSRRTPLNTRHAGIKPQQNCLKFEISILWLLLYECLVWKCMPCLSFGNRH